LRLLILVAREWFLKDKCSPRTKMFEHHCWKGLRCEEIYIRYLFLHTLPCFVPGFLHSITWIVLFCTFSIHQRNMLYIYIEDTVPCSNYGYTMLFKRCVNTDLQHCKA